MDNPETRSDVISALKKSETLGELIVALEQVTIEYSEVNCEQCLARTQQPAYCFITRFSNS